MFLLTCYSCLQGSSKICHVVVNDGLYWETVIFAIETSSKDLKSVCALKKQPYSGWWFGNIFYCPWYIWDNPFHWLSYFSRWLKPSTSIMVKTSNLEDDVAIRCCHVGLSKKYCHFTWLNIFSQPSVCVCVFLIIVSNSKTYMGTIWLFNSSPWKDPPFLSSANHLFRLGPSIPWRTVSHNQRVNGFNNKWFPLVISTAKNGDFNWWFISQCWAPNSNDFFCSFFLLKWPTILGFWSRTNPDESKL